MFSKESREYICKGIVGFLTRCSRNWFPVLVVLGVFAPMAGIVGHNLGLPHLFRDDEKLWNYEFAPYVKSSLIWGHAAATLLVLALWSGIFLQDELKPDDETQSGHDPLFSLADLCRYLIINSWPFFLLLPIAALLNTDVRNDHTGWFTDVLKSMAGIAIGLAIAAVGVFVIRRWIYGILFLDRANFLVRFAIALASRIGVIRKQIDKAADVLGIPAGENFWQSFVEHVLKIFSKNGSFVGIKYWLRVFLYALIILVITGAFTIYPVVVPGVALCILLVWIVGTYFVFSAISPAVRTPIVIVFGGLVFLAGSDPYPNRFEDFQKGSIDAYKDPLDLANLTKVDKSRLLEPIPTLDSWKAHLADIRANGAAACQSKVTEIAAADSELFKPPLVIISTSGGAYRAGFWVAKVLDQLLHRNADGGDLEGLFDHVRLLTGASGGMVGSAYLAAAAPDPCVSASQWSPGVEKNLRDDIRTSRDSRLPNHKDIPGEFKTKYPLDRDGLGPVAQQILQRDIPRYFLTPLAKLTGLKDALVDWEKWKDRGWVLEEQWGRLTASFSDFETGEKAGWRPSLIFSPMVVETGQPLIISNLNSSHLARIDKDPNGLATELFNWFPYMQEQLKIRTAVRMNASFPYVSPAVSLPTTPARRVVDAGYYDNHGVSIAATWIQEPHIWNWIKTNTSGVIFIQIRAFSSENEVKKEHKNTGFQWLFSPLEGVLSARSNGSRARNDQLIENLQGRIDSEEIEKTGEKLDRVKFVHSFVFENRAGSKDASMSWYLPEHELKDMDAQFTVEKHNQDALKALIDIWKKQKPSKPGGN